MNKKKKAIGIITNVLVVVILLLVALITLSIILSQGKGYTSVLGSAYVAVQSDSMEGTYDDSFAYSVKGFNQGDLIKVRILNDDEKTKLQVGEVITFYQIKNGERVLNTHRIIKLNYTDQGLKYVTQGDKAAAGGSDYAVENVNIIDVVGRYEGFRIAGLGKAVDFFHSSVGFFVCVVLPAFILVAYFAINLVMTVKSAKDADKKDAYDLEKEKMREELMKELREENKNAEEASAGTKESEIKPEEGAK